MGQLRSNVGVIALSAGRQHDCERAWSTSLTRACQLPQYGFLNTGTAIRTPRSRSPSRARRSGVSAAFIQPAGGSFAFGLFSLDLGGGNATPFGTFGIAIDDSGGQRSGKAYYGDLEFTLTRTSGLSTMTSSPTR